jgi:hypothetical protein
MTHPPHRHNLARLALIAGVILLAAIFVGPSVLRHLRNHHSPAPTFDPASLPEPIVNLTASLQADGSLKLTWAGGAHCDGFLISETRPLTGWSVPLADLPAGQFTYTVAPTAGEAWDCDIWVQGHCARWGFGAPQRIRPPPAPDIYQSANATAPATQ